MRGRSERTGSVGEDNIPEKKCVGSNPRHDSQPWQPCYYYHVLFSHSATLANLSPNDQRHITIRTGSSTRARFGKCQTGMPRVYTSTKASVSEPNGLPFKLSLLKFYLFLCLLLNWRKFYIPTKVPPGLLFALIM